MANDVAKEGQTDFWKKIYQMARRILDLGSLLGVVAYLIFGRKFRNDELGILVWPLTGLYIVSLFYVLTFLVFISVKSCRRNRSARHHWRASLGSRADLHIDKCRFHLGSEFGTGEKLE